jgi:hypothetical protein
MSVCVEYMILGTHMMSTWFCLQNQVWQIASSGGQDATLAKSLVISLEGAPTNCTQGSCHEAYCWGMIAEGYLTPMREEKKTEWEMESGTKNDANSWQSNPPGVPVRVY